MTSSIHVEWTDYMKYRAKKRGFDLDKLEHIVRYSAERYFDLTTARSVVIGRHDKSLVIIPYEVEVEEQKFRLNTGRFIHG
jgi:hypothetical protein